MLKESLESIYELGSGVRGINKKGRLQKVGVKVNNPLLMKKKVRVIQPTGYLTN